MFGWVLAVTLAYNTFTFPAYYSFIGSGRLKWNTVSQLSRLVVLGVLGLTLGTYFSENGIVAAAAGATIIVGVIIMAAYHLENHLPLFASPLKHSVILIVSFTIVSITLIVTHYFLVEYSLVIKCIFATVIPIVILAPVLYYHPFYRQLICEMGLRST